MRSTLTLLCLMFLCTLNAVAQQLNVTGNVKDALGEYIIGASVLVKGTTNGTITDIDGNFSVSGVEKGSVLEISYIGYVSQSITINDYLKRRLRNLRRGSSRRVRSSEKSQPDWGCHFHEK